MIVKQAQDTDMRRDPSRPPTYNSLGHLQTLTIHSYKKYIPVSITTTLKSALFDIFLRMYQTDRFIVEWKMFKIDHRR
jgi:hypothetical protein